MSSIYVKKLSVLLDVYLHEKWAIRYTKSLLVFDPWDVVAIPIWIYDQKCLVFA